MCDHEQMYIIHVHTQRVQVQKVHSQEAVLCPCADEQSAGKEKAPQGQRAGFSTVCRFLLEQKERRGQQYKKERRREKERERGRASGQFLLGVIFSRSWIPSLSIKRTVKEGRFRMKRLLSWMETKTHEFYHLYTPILNTRCRNTAHRHSLLPHTSSGDPLLLLCSDLQQHTRQVSR